MDSSKAVFQVGTYVSQRGRHKVCTVELDLSGRFWSPKSLLKKAVQHQLSVWKLSPPPSSNVYNLNQAIRLISDRLFIPLNTEPRLLSREDASDLLLLVRDEFSLQGHSDAKFEHIYYAIRKLLTRMPIRLKDGLTFAQAATKQTKRPHLPPAQLPNEIGHISHTDLKDLRSKTEKILQERKNSLEKAIASELHSYEETFALQNELLTINIDSKVYEKIAAWVKAPKASEIAPLPRYSARDFSAVFLQHLRKEKLPFCSSGFVPDARLPRSRIDWTQIPNVLEYRFKYSLLPWFLVHHRLPNTVLTAIFLLLLSHTAWNPGSVGELTVDGIIRLPEGGYRLQSYKSKTDDHTPLVEVPRHMALLCKSIDLLLWNYEQLGKFSLINTKKEKRVWFGWQDDDFKTTIDFAHESRIKSLCNRHGIEPFAASELRPLKAALTYIPQGDLEAVRVLLGHNDLKTSDDYLKNTLFFRLNEAMILEFQRRIETTITYIHGGEALIVKRSLSSKNIDGKLFLVPTGDGGACANFLDGPKSASTSADEPCEALACHNGSGCHNYRTVINETTLEMAMRSLAYYRSRWQSLFEQNRLAFSKLHLPKIIYTYVLLRIASEQRPDIYLKAEKALG
ncbi:hypothetical protein [Massilia timonae]|uniref:hypothetical protein n=1 Tax=Massilia timonae TaxID=47229 RepID=UPI002356610F|nr:hypothetical protein [Massilia timonae]